MPETAGAQVFPLEKEANPEEPRDGKKLTTDDTFCGLRSRCAISHNS